MEISFTKFRSNIKASFIALFRSNLKDEDVTFIRENLTKQEQILFYRQSQFDQKHALLVAYTIRDMIGKRTKVRLEKLYKAALLHDVGKLGMKLSWKDRVTQTLFFTFLKPIANFLADRGAGEHTGRIRRLLHNKKYHPKIGSQLAAEIGVEPAILYLIEHHEEPLDINEPKELSILREADNLN